MTDDRSSGSAVGLVVADLFLPASSPSNGSDDVIPLMTFNDVHGSLRSEHGTGSGRESHRGWYSEGGLREQFLMDIRHTFHPSSLDLVSLLGLQTSTSGPPGVGGEVGGGDVLVPEVFDTSLYPSSPIPRDHQIWTPDVIFRVTSISVVIALTLVGNVALIAVITGHASLCRKRVSIFLLNLAAGDLMVCCLTMTSEILFVAFGEWVLGAVACKLIVYLEIVTLASTTFLLTAMSIDRYQVGVTF